MKNLSASYKGLITGLLMVVMSVLIYYYKKSFDNPLQYITYGIFIAGILWTLIEYKRSSAISSFKSLFQQGFKCFVVVSLVMVVYTFTFLKLNQNLKEEMAQNFRTELVKTGNATPQEIADRVQQAKDSFVMVTVSATIFGYLLIGSLITLIASGFLNQQRK